MKGLSLFSNVGIGETYLKDIGIEIVVANELLKDRAEFYKVMHPNTKMICGDITNEKVYSEIIESARGVDFLLATPPCQGMSQANAIKNPDDIRNSLIKMVVRAINDLEPKYILIENVPGMAKTFINHEGEGINILDFVRDNIPVKYQIRSKVMDAANFGTPQHRKRLITLISIDGNWDFPQESFDHITVRDAIGHLPSLESGEETKIKWHFAKKHNKNHILWMQNTPTGKTAFDNIVHYPKKLDTSTGKYRRISGFKTTYKRIEWDRPSPAVTMANGSISSQNNVHPGQPLQNGLYSDARVLTVKEIVLLCGLPENHYDFVKNEKQSFLRKVLGECFPPKLCLEICKTIPCHGEE